MKNMPETPTSGDLTTNAFMLPISAKNATTTEQDMLMDNRFVAATFTLSDSSPELNRPITAPRHITVNAAKTLFATLLAEEEDAHRDRAHHVRANY